VEKSRFTNGDTVCATAMNVRGTFLKSSYEEDVIIVTERVMFVVGRETTIVGSRNVVTEKNMTFKRITLSESGESVEFQEKCPYH
jgi:hypothetical protein